MRAAAALSLVSGGEVIARGAGELQFTETGVSGPAAFDISRAVSTGGGKAGLHIDFLRGYDGSAVAQMLRARCRALPDLPCGEVFTGMLHNRLGRMLVKYAGLDAAVRAAKDFTLTLTGTEGFDSAQVTAGGIRTSGFDPESLQSWFMPRLFVCGELLDIDGDCGGYNLQWAWASGHVAGRLGE